MLAVVFEEFKVVHIIFATFFSLLSWSICKMSILAKIWGRGNAVAPAGLRHSPLGLYGTRICFRTFF